MASKRKAISVDEKICVIRAIEKGEKKSDVGRRFELSQSTVATIWKNQITIQQAALEGNLSKKLRKPKFEDLDQAMLSWFNNQRQNNVPISGPIVKAKAEKFANQLGIIDFKASEEDIFNADETGLFFKLTPDKTLKFKGEKCVGGKLSKERITVLVAANMSGTEKRKLLVIGKSKNPRCFKNIKQLPVTYKANKSAWMTSQIFEEEVRKWDAELKSRKILLLVDNCPAHPIISNLRNIELAFFPANATSILQPMDQSVIKSLKGHYRRKMLMDMIETDGKVSINMLQAVNFISKAWQEVTAATIQHSFRHAGLCSSQETNQFNSEDNLPLSEWISQFNVPNNFNEDLQSYENIDEDVATTGTLTDEQIVDLVSKSQETPDNQDEEDDQVDKAESPPTIQQALDAAKLVKSLQMLAISKIGCDVGTRIWTYTPSLAISLAADCRVHGRLNQVL
ncbi:tigger transposable element-derived protein 4-like [Pararge aegeria]|uniref:tigger transposable element-derived protein 4-like n=1 Tax=Pararge aegeria TaxID=116150 RepID=UPI0019D29049|nr:tigger transposable element-derived protein 4-like [Pararge aegeria]